MSKHDIFICFSSKDEATARKVLQFLEARGLKCWISFRDVRAGQNYQESIVQAIEDARGIVFLFSKSSSESSEIKKELSLAGRFNLPVFPLRLSPITPTGALRYELATRQWIDIFPDTVQALGKLAETLDEALNRPAAAPAKAIQPATKKRLKKVRGPKVIASSAELEAVRALLAHYIGPIAKILVQKALTDAQSLDDLCERLAAHVSTPADRANFLQAARGRLSSVKR